MVALVALAAGCNESVLPYVAPPPRDLSVRDLARTVYDLATPDEGLAAATCPCFLGDCTDCYCGHDIAAWGAAHGCQVAVSRGNPGDLYSCMKGAWSPGGTCNRGCFVAAPPTRDGCGDSSEYRLPWPCGGDHRLVRGNLPYADAGVEEYGYDFAMDKGTPVVAARAGVVSAVYATTVPGDPCYLGCPMADPAACCAQCAARANLVKIDHLDKTDGLYLHLDAVTVKVGDRIEQGQQIGTSGRTGCVADPRLHFQVEQGDARSPIVGQSVAAVFYEAGVPLVGQLLRSANRCP